MTETAGLTLEVLKKIVQTDYVEKVFKLIDQSYQGKGLVNSHDFNKVNGNIY